MSFVPVRGIDDDPTLIIISERYTNIKWHASLIQVLRMHYNLSFSYSINCKYFITKNSIYNITSKNRYIIHRNLIKKVPKSKRSLRFSYILHFSDMIIKIPYTTLHLNHLCLCKFFSLIMFWREPQRFQTNRKTKDNKTPLEKCNKTLIGQTVLYLRGKPKFGICPERIQILSSKIGHNKPLTYQKLSIV